MFNTFYVEEPRKRTGKPWEVRLTQTLKCGHTALAPIQAHGSLHESGSADILIK